jgi:hypothetical protein
VGGRRDLNPQQPEPQSGALPLSYDHHIETENEISSSSCSAKEILARDSPLRIIAIPSRSFMLGR